MKLFFAFDLDGTLLRYDNTIHPENVKMLKKLYELGHILVVATGRGLSACIDLAKQYPYFHYLVSNNGTLVYDIATKKTINNGTLKKQVAFDLFRDCQESNSICAFSTPHSLFEYSSQKSYDWLKKQHIMDLNYYTKVNNFEILEIIETDPITQIAFRNDEKLIKDLYKKWSKKLENHYKVTITNRIFLDINPLNVDKASAISDLLVKNNLTTDHLVAFGDSSNDFQMIKLARYGFAMQDATPDLIEVASRKIGSCKSDTIARTIDILLENQDKLFSA
ncbi:Cof-type HAD-IIB family hydrolase [Mesomycoplasma ovipneumoniae]|uniref:Cof-type HAD-IIB family hydrolase n=1 Tax=Mesomycoplasma ovipneumoniae TaxID=29562 RepID=UPI0029650748|nr:Cof-type HAD-IIB family hydrolase [Mesomycoplasma ovipneumoniae]MDW2922252.1 Cof-type HAD-IIB family hydrolase [Mesomycoplasma ovipneumoniae]